MFTTYKTNKYYFKEYFISRFYANLRLMQDNRFSVFELSNLKSIARAISLVENEAPGYDTFLQSLNTTHNSQIIGITGPPGAGKSTLTDALIGELVNDQKKIAVLCIDPSSPFHLGALLGDRIRMSEWHNHPNVFIRSLASRGSLGGLHPKIIEITDILKAANFDYIIIETVGVGQSEIEIAGIADTTVVVLVPESGDEIQTMKAGLMEIGNVFVVNKADRPGAEVFIRNMQQMLAPAFQTHKKEIPILKTIATQKQGVVELNQVLQQLASSNNKDRKTSLLAEKAYQLIKNKRMKDVSREELKTLIASIDNFNLYQFVNNY